MQQTREDSSMQFEGIFLKSKTECFMVYRCFGNKNYLLTDVSSYNVVHLKLFSMQANATASDFVSRSECRHALVLSLVHISNRQIVKVL